jgi:uncharacterized protein (DUF1778 family)
MWRWRRKCIKYFGCEPETIYVSQHDYDELVGRINEPPDPETVEKLKKILNRKAPWDDTNDYCKR